MVSGDFCQHDWPGSGCPGCKAEAPAPALVSETVAEGEAVSLVEKDWEAIYDMIAGGITVVASGNIEIDADLPQRIAALLAHPSSEVASLRAELAAETAARKKAEWIAERMTAERKRLSDRIAHQRYSLRENWMIVETRARGLRSSALHIYKKGRALVAEARAAEAKVEGLRTALEPFAKIAAEYSASEDDDFQVWKDFDVLGATLPLRIFRCASQAYLASQDQDGAA